MYVTEADLRRIINKELSPEQAKRREETKRRSREIVIDPGIVMKPGVVVQDPNT